MKQYKVRRDVMNLPPQGWDLVKDLEVLEGDLYYFYDLFGNYLRGLSAKFNEEEKEFFKDYFEYLHNK